MLTISEENHLKAIYACTDNVNAVSTNTLANLLKTKASSITDMTQRLAEKNLVIYKAYKGVELTKIGQKKALYVIRKHRLWEVFLVQHLKFGWEEVHEIAEQLEHIQSEALVNKLDDFLGNPQVDPHGEPIPNRDGKLPILKQKKLLSDIKAIVTLKVIGVKDESSSFLHYLRIQNFHLGLNFKITEILEFDGTFLIETETGNKLSLSNLATTQIYVQEI